MPPFGTMFQQTFFFHNKTNCLLIVGVYTYTHTHKPRETKQKSLSHLTSTHSLIENQSANAHTHKQGRDNKRTLTHSRNEKQQLNGVGYELRTRCLTI